MRRRRGIAGGFVALTSTLLLTMAGSVAAQGLGGGNRIYFGPPPTPAQEDKFPTFSGQIAFAGYDAHFYSGISLREALDQYGLFGRRYRWQNGSAPNSPAAPGDSSAGESETAMAVLWVLLPPDADLWIAGQATSSRGPARQFVTPPLTPGAPYSGEIRARWLEDGRAIVRSQTITVYPGDRRTIDFRAPPNEPILLKPPRKLGE